ncbi:hypothetical protein [Flavobacterium sp.]|uniref:hypothetical protein n=1 Tax=Flavobacterium sp. TaxID=239 RepID=UPI00260191D9|nr:hypothetical protein [Flavobacterium sp.]
MKNRSLLVIILSLTLFFSSCSNEENSSINVPGTIVKKMKFVGANWNNDFENHEINFQYENGKLTSYSDGTGLKVDFFYTNNLISRVDKYIRVNQQPTFYLSVDFFYDAQERLVKFEADQNPASQPGIDITVDFSYTNNNNANFNYASLFENYNGTITFDQNNVTKLVKNNFNPNYNSSAEENYMNYDSKKHIFSDVIGFRNLNLYNAFYFGQFYNFEGFGIYPGGKNNLTTLQIKLFYNGYLASEGISNSINYQYGTNDFPIEASKNSQSRMLFEF